MQNALAFIIFNVLLAAVIATTISTVRHKVPVKLTEKEVEMSVSFLLQCTYFKDIWPVEHKVLQDTAEFNIIIPDKGERTICGRYIGALENKYIILYPKAWLDNGCYGANPMLVLSHELLHQVGLPPHYISTEDWDAYLRYDLIEITIRKCFMEARQFDRPTSWTKSKEWKR